MKLFFSFLSLFICISCDAQQKDELNHYSEDTTHIISFTTRFDMNDLNKDDETAVIKGYVVFIRAEQAKKINGKNVRITGAAILKKAAKRTPGQIIPQERQGPYWYIESPQIVLIKN